MDNRRVMSGPRGAGNSELVINGYGILGGKNERVLEMDDGFGFTTV
jgi:hypothetical protein